VVPDAVPWPKAAIALNTHFGILNHSTLKETDLYLLQRKLGGRPTAPRAALLPAAARAPKQLARRLADAAACVARCTADTPEAIVTWTMFNRSSMPGYPFAFWEWFFAAEELVKRHLHQLWPEMCDAVTGAGRPACCSRLTISVPCLFVRAGGTQARHGLHQQGGHGGVAAAVPAGNLFAAFQRDPAGRY